jgi:hypothetical protein
MNQQRRTPRILVIGLDGATYDLLQPMIQAGWLPNVQRALNEGAHGVLRSTVPPLTAPAWTSFQTGLNPGRHGVFSFQRRSRRHALEREFVNSTSHRWATRLWHWLAQHGLTSGVINLPMTWPPQPMPTGSYLVSGMETPSTDHPFTDPPELADELRARGYICDSAGQAARARFSQRQPASPPSPWTCWKCCSRREAAILQATWLERPTDALGGGLRDARSFAALGLAGHRRGAGQARGRPIARTPLHEAVAGLLP